MDVVQSVEAEIAKLTEEVDNFPKNSKLYIERAKLYYRLGRFEKALNDYIIASEIDPANIEVQEHIKMLRRIFNYRYVDIYNP